MRRAEHVYLCISIVDIFVSAKSRVYHLGPGPLAAVLAGGTEGSASNLNTNSPWQGICLLIPHFEAELNGTCSASSVVAVRYALKRLVQRGGAIIFITLSHPNSRIFKPYIFLGRG